MATKKSEKQAAKAPPPKSASRPVKAPPIKAKGGKAATFAPAEKKVKPAPLKQGPRHPRGRLVAGHGSKEALAKSLASAIAVGDQDSDQLVTRLKKASNKQLLRLARVSETVQKKWGGREQLIAAIGKTGNKSKDKDYLAKLATYSLPQLLDLATSQERATRATRATAR